MQIIWPIRSFNILWINCCGLLRLDCRPHIRNQSKVPPGHGKNSARLEAATFPQGNRERPNNRRHSATSCPLSAQSISTRPVLDCEEVKTDFLALTELNTSKITVWMTVQVDPLSRWMSDSTTATATITRLGLACHATVTPDAVTDQTHTVRLQHRLKP